MGLEPLLIVVKLKPRSCLGKFKTLESKIIWQRIWHSIPKQIKRLIHRHWPWHIHHSYDHAYNFELDIGHRSSTFWPISNLFARQIIVWSYLEYPYFSSQGSLLEHLVVAHGKRHCTWQALTLYVCMWQDVTKHVGSQKLQHICDLFISPWLSGTDNSGQGGMLQCTISVYHNLTPTNTS